MKTIYHGGQVFTGSLPLAQAFAVEDGRFLAAGTDEELLALRAEGDVLVDLAGRFVCPGFNDSHMHLVNYGNLMNMCDLTGSATVSLAAVQSALRASLLMHLPMLTRGKKMGQVVQLVAKVGMNIRGVYGEGSEALGDVYLLSNQVSLGRSEQELISMVTTLGHQLMDMEQSLRAMALQDGRLPLEDVVWRAYGVLSNARILPMNEFYDHWSNLRLGAALGMINLSPDRVDTLLDMAQPAHLCCWREEDLTGRDLDKARADRVRDALIS